MTRTTGHWLQYYQGLHIYMSISTSYSSSLLLSTVPKGGEVEFLLFSFFGNFLCAILWLNLIYLHLSSPNLAVAVLNLYCAAETLKGLDKTQTISLILRISYWMDLERSPSISISNKVQDDTNATWSRDYFEKYCLIAKMMVKF